eukprot:8028079-Pyramimonas_sp.AAC.1
MKIEHGNINFYLANYTKWGDKARAYLAEKRMGNIGMHFGVGTHVRDGQLVGAQKKFRKAGWTCKSSPA